jgi:hypothetical protein
MELRTGSFDPNGSASVEMELRWSMPLKGALSISVHLLDSRGGRTVSEFDGVYSIVKDLELYGAPIITMNGRSIEETGAHALPGSDIGIDGIGIRYRHVPDRTPVPGGVMMVLSSGGIERDSRMNGDGSSFSFDAGHTDPDEMEVTISIPGMEIFDEHYPDTGTPVRISIPVDTAAPDAPSEMDLSVSPILVDGEIKHTTRIEWKSSLGTGGDHNGSGVSHYLLNSHGLHEGPVMKTGGLMATCFLDPDFRQEGYAYIEEAMVLNWGPWGPEPNIIPPYGYSVRWHGWIVQEEGGDLRFRCDGRGEIKIVMDNITVLPWTDLRDSPVSKFHPVKKDEAVPLQIYYRLMGGESRILVRLEDTRGRDLTLGNVDTMFPVSNFEINSDLGSKVQTEIRAVDWTGRVSDPARSVEWIDRTPPVLDLGDLPEWTGARSIEVNAVVADPVSEGGVVSGLDAGSIEYRYWDPEEVSTGLPPWTSEGLKMEDAGEDPPLIIDLSFLIEVDRDWSGYIQFRASDLMSNDMETEPRRFGFDLTAPEIEFISPSNGAVVNEGDVSFMARARDWGGSGVADSSLEIRWRSTEGSWTDWNQMEEDLLEGEIMGSFMAGLPRGAYDVQARCMDNVGRRGYSGDISISIIEKKVNHPPVPVIALPLNGSSFSWNDPIPLDATGTRDDGLGPFSALRLAWFSNISGPLAQGGTARLYLDKGHHRITLFADDGEFNVSTSVEVFVSVRPGPDDDDDAGPDDDIEVDEGGSYWWLFLVIFIVFAAVVAMMVLVKIRDRYTVETRMDVVERSEDDLLYDEISWEDRGD